MDNISPRIAISYALSEDQKWKFNSSLGRYFKIPTYTMLGFQNIQSIFINQNLKYTRSDHFVAGIEYNLTPVSRITIEGFYKKYSQYPVSKIDGVSLANKGGGFEVLGNEVVTSDGRKVIYTSTDQAGNFRIGDDLQINQNTGTISGRAFSKSLFSEMTPFILALS